MLRVGPQIIVSGTDLVERFDTMESPRLRQMLGSGFQVLNCHRVLGKTDDNIVGELLKGQGTFYEWDHYPPGDVYDGDNNSQYYYHAHPQSERTGEHGHFHSFLHPEAIPIGHKALAEPPGNELDEDEVALCHLVGISMDPMGIPIRLFTTNRWVTGEIQYEAEALIAALDEFEIDLAYPSWPVNVWLTHMLRLFRPEIEDLLRERDETLTKWQEDHPGSNAFEDRDLEVTSSLDISVDNQVASIRGALAARGDEVSKFEV